jgi:uncharacterized protein YukE
MSVRVDPHALRSLASSFQSAADRLSQRSAQFAEQARLEAPAFGALPAGRSAHADYSERLQEALLSLQRLETTLRALAENIETAADNWVQADHDSASGAL